MTTITARCSDLVNNCPSRDNCRRYTERGHNMDGIPAASLNCRREAGASACDLWMPISRVSTFSAAQKGGGA